MEVFNIELECCFLNYRVLFCFVLMLMSYKKAWLKPSSGKAFAQSIFPEEVIHTQDNFLQAFSSCLNISSTNVAEGIQLQNRMRFKEEKTNVGGRTNKTQNVILFKVKLQF